MNTEDRLKALAERTGCALAPPVKDALREAFDGQDQEWGKVCAWARNVERRLALRDAAAMTCRYCLVSESSMPPSKDRKSGNRYHPVPASNGPPGQDWCAASRVWDLLEGREEVEAEATRRLYWRALITAVRAMDGIQSCVKCRPRAPMALDRASICDACALRVAEGVERAALGWRDQHDLVRRVAVAFASAFRRYRDSSRGTREIFENWDAHLAAHEAGAGTHPQEVRTERTKAMMEARKAFWDAVRELDGLVPDEEIDKCRRSEAASASSGGSAG